MFLGLFFITYYYRIVTFRFIYHHCYCIKPLQVNVVAVEVVLMLLSHSSMIQNVHYSQVQPVRGTVTRSVMKTQIVKDVTRSVGVMVSVAGVVLK